MLDCRVVVSESARQNTSDSGAVRQFSVLCRAQSSVAVQKARARALTVVVIAARMAKARLTEYWLLSATGSQPDNRVTRYYGFWRRLKPLAPPGKCFERALALNAHVQFATAAKLSGPDLHLANEVARIEK